MPHLSSSKEEALYIYAGATGFVNIVWHKFKFLSPVICSGRKGSGKCSLLHL